jgi:hypothetical protein
LLGLSESVMPACLNPGEARTGSPIETFGRDEFGERHRNGLSKPGSLLRVVQFALAKDGLGRLVSNRSGSLKVNHG